MPHTVNEILQDRAIRHAVFLERLKTHEANQVLNFLDTDVLPDLQRRIDNVLAATPNLTRSKGIKSTKRLQAMMAGVERVLKESTDQIYNKSRDEFFQVAEMEAKFQAKMLDDAFPVDVGITLPATQILHSAVVSNPFQGNTLRGWWNNVNIVTQAQIQSQLNIGLTFGESNEQLATRLFGIQGGSVFNKLRRNAVTITRTAVTAATTQAREATYKANGSVIKGVRYLATLDARTTDICASLDGRVFKIGQGPRPPLHMRCRSTTVPITKSWQELGFNFKDLNEGQRASMNGLVPERLNYRQWLAGQSKKVQNQVLGKSRAAIFRADPRNPDQAFDRFVDDNFKSVSLADIKKAEGLE